MTDRCEPPPELRGVDGWHWVMVGDGPEEIAQWFAGIGGTICGWWMGGNSAPQSQEWIEDDHGEPMRYLYPVATPAEVEALQYEIHDLRHEGISWLFENTNLTDIQISKMTGHLELDTLKRYAKLRPSSIGERLWAQTTA